MSEASSVETVGTWDSHFPAAQLRPVVVCGSLDPGVPILQSCWRNWKSGFGLENHLSFKMLVMLSD